jgi:uncharacterized protein with PQ loop repeat
MNHNIFTRFQSKLCPESIAIWWVTPESLDLKSDYLVELDYFFDGLISKSIRSSSTKKVNNLFLIHQSFGNPLYLIYSDETQASIYLKQSLKLIKPSSHQQLIHPLSISQNILGQTKVIIEKTGLKLAPLIDGMSS